MKEFKRIFLLLALIFGLLATAQVRTLKIYKNGVVYHSINAESIDSVLVTKKQQSSEHSFDFYRNGYVFKSIESSNIDSLKVAGSLVAPTSVTGRLVGNYIQLSWTAVPGADSYNIYRSNSAYNYSYIGNTGSNIYTDTNPTVGSNYYKVEAISSRYGTAMSSPSNAVNVVESGLYMGVIGFNETLKTKEISILTPNTKSQFTQFVNGLSSNVKNTVLYRAVDEAIDKLASASLPGDMINVSIVTFTDGLDQGSAGYMYDKYGCLTETDSRNKLNSRIKTVSIHNQPMTAYSIGLKGNDVTDEALFMSNLESLASPENSTTSEKYSYLANNMDEVNATFEKIANQLVSITYSQTITLKIPVKPHGKKIRFTFDNVSDASLSSMYIEGTFSLINKSLENIKYYGITAESGSSVVGSYSDPNVTFTFEGVSKTNGGIVPISNIQQWDAVDNTAQWQKNSEFSSGDNVTSTEHRKSAVVMLVLDCSSSLGSDFAKIQTYANNFITTISEGTKPSTDGSTASNTINGHEYIDLGLPSGLKWATCNVGASSPEDYGNYYAWGETYTKSTYTTSNSVTYGKTMSDISGNATYDAARANWGGTWRMPTATEIDELVNNCTWTWTAINSIYGYKVTSPNGNSIFLPAAGFRDGSSLYIAGSDGEYWSSTPYKSGSGGSYELYFNSSSHSRDFNGRYYGQSVRPVSE